MNLCKKFVIAFFLILCLQTSTQEVQAFPWRQVAVWTGVAAASVLLYYYWPEISAALATKDQGTTDTFVDPQTFKSVLTCIHEKLTAFECPSAYWNAGKTCLKDVCSKYAQFAQECVINLVQAARHCAGSCVEAGAKALAEGNTPFDITALERNCSRSCAEGYVVHL